ncbi:hypothetical protein B0A78_03965 [Flavobacterium columnare NBRC 100251 = ATCC 23463]|uniref:hypothetical protein n=1 Tax=Flavobacterium TaxID=237 RepID=UPI0007F99699|nr:MULTISPECIES: hypothetical protein [Flavobacterium]ANO47060.1 hypothetical protein Pf1_01603 [Flavobacterium columnare]APT22248.1 hypothetical protein BU993_06150 [Flavobacterium columnare]MBF6653782.1 hypothetical protein [Flavobacterium columnare]MBF6655594.1 hypothetical protein [Flavobacterium columnare]MBF6657705.1 hypothetical protein [Flavobacterium columnare]
MLTDTEMLEIANKFLNRLSRDSNNLELVLYSDIIKKSYGNIYFFNSKKFILSEDLKYALGGNAPFLVEKKTGRVVSFGTSCTIENYIKDYENGTIGKSLDRYWYPDEDRFDYK